MRLISLFLIVLMTCTSVWGASTRTIDGDAIRSSNTTFTQSMPAATGTVMLSVGLIQTVLTGVNGTQTTFTLPSTPATQASLVLYLNGVLQTYTVEYTLSGATVTMVTAPAAGQSLIAAYTIY